MGARDWRRAEDYAEVAACDLSALAWEFLRRNPAYRRAFQQSLRDPSAPVDPSWGLRVLVSPDLPASRAPLFWRAEIAPAHVVVLVPSPAGGASLARLARGAEARLSTVEGEHLRLPRGLQVMAPGPPDAVPLAAATPLDPDLGVRLTALGALERLLAGAAPAPDPLPPLTRARTVKALRALDGRLSGASYREVAEHLVGGVPEDGRSWRTSTARDVAIRLCRTARRLMGGDYRLLLRRRR